MKQQPKANAQGINNYVPAMQYAADANHSIWSGSLGTPLYQQNGILLAGTGNAANGTTLYFSDFTGTQKGESLATFGQSVVLKVSADPGAGGIDVDVYGEDYLGQPMVERHTTASGAVVEYEGQKAFKRVLKLVLFNNATGAITYAIGWGHLIGLPYKYAQLLGYAEGSEMTVPPTATPVMQVPDTTDPATVVTNDPRGMVTAIGTLNGLTPIWIRYVANNAVNAAGRGGYHGIKHFAG